MDTKEAGRKGGEATKQKYGPEHFKKIGKAGGDKTKQRWAKLKEMERAEK